MHSDEVKIDIILRIYLINDVSAVIIYNLHKASNAIKLAQCNSKISLIKIVARASKISRMKYDRNNLICV